MKSKLIFYMGYSEGFNGKNYNEKHIFGSEINAIKLAESLVNLYDIYIFVNIEESDEICWKGVTYLNMFKLNSLTYTDDDILIIVRYINYFLYFDNKIKNIYLWICDTIINPYYMGIRITNNASHLINNVKSQIKSFVFLSDWHIKNNEDILTLKELDYKIIHNPLDTRYYRPNIQIIKNRFIYTSDPNRGLIHLLDCLIYIQSYFDDISLVVFRKEDFTEEIKNKIKQIKNVEIYGKVSQEIIALEYLKSDFFFYPTNFYETFCNCAAEAQLYKCVCIYNNIGGLSSTIDNRGLRINYSINQLDYVKNTSNMVIELMHNTKLKEYYRTIGHNWSKNLNIDFIKNQWIDLFT